MDGDGDLDAVTARFHNSKINSWLKEIKKTVKTINFVTAVEEQNFLWLENPGQVVPGINIDHISHAGREYCNLAYWH